MVTARLDNFSLSALENSGQCFRVTEKKGVYRFITGRHVVYVKEDTDHSIFSFDCTLEEYNNIWTPYFDITGDYDSLVAQVPTNDKYMTAAARYGRCTRILRQDLWETICSFIISQNNNIPRIKSSISKLCGKYGDAIYFPNGNCCIAFPTAEKLASLTLDDLQGIGLGYRDKYILRLAQDVASGKVDLTAIANMDDTAALAALKSIYGIGDKVANCIMLYGLHRLDAFPVDTHIKQILLREYDGAEYRGLDKKQKLQRIIQDHIDIYSGHRGVVQQYMFDYETRQQVN